MQTYTRTVDEHLILNGRKTYVNNGEYAPYIMVAAIDRDCEAPGKYPPMTFWLLPLSAALFMLQPTGHSASRRV